MQNAKYKIRTTAGLTLVEMIIAMAIMVIVFAAIVPQFSIILKSWDSRQAGAEVLQNGRVLIDHINRNLSKAVRITAVSASSVTNGYIQFVANDSNTYRYDIGESSYVEYGPVGSLSDLAGPVSSLQFTCYNGNNFTNTTTDGNSIRFVSVQTILPNPSAMGHDKTFTASIYLRTNSSSIWELNKGTNFEFDAVEGHDVALAQIDGTHYLCAYAGNNSDGYAVVLTVDTSLGITKGTPHQYTTSDSSDGRYPALAKIDSTNYLCVYRNKRSADGTYLQYAVVLTVDIGACTVMEKASTRTQTRESIDNPSFNCKYHSMVKLDGSNYLCVYSQDTSGPGHAEALGVNPLTLEITSGPPCIYTPTTNYRGTMPDLARIDNTHGLCVYYDNQSGHKGDWAVVLTVDANLGVRPETAYLYTDKNGGNAPAIAQIDNTHYLTAYNWNSHGYAVVLTVNTGNWTISKGTSFQFDTASISTPVLGEIDPNHYLCAYSVGGNGWAVILTVNPSSWTISKEQASLEWETSTNEPALAKVNTDVNDALFLCAYVGGSSHGWSVGLEATKIRP